MKNKLSIFSRSQVFDRACTNFFGLFLVIALLVPGVDKLILFDICILLFMYFFKSKKQVY